MIYYEEGVFTDKQLENFRKYKRVQESGEWNMLSPQAIQAVGCSEEEYFFIIKNYEALKTANSAWVLAERTKRGTN